MKKFIVFDLDGTLVDTLIGITKSVNRTLEFFQYDFRYTYDEVKGMIGNGARKLFLRFTKRESFDEALEKEYCIFKQFYEEDQYISKPYPGVISTLKELENAGISLTVYSNKPHELLKKLLATLMPDIHFVFIQGQDENYKVKPDVTLLNKRLEEHELSPVYGLYVGDSLVDFETANNAKMDFVFLDYGYCNKEDKCKVFSPILSNFSEIKDYLK